MSAGQALAFYSAFLVFKWIHFATSEKLIFFFWSEKYSKKQLTLSWLYWSHDSEYFSAEFKGLKDLDIIRSVNPSVIHHSHVMKINIGTVGIRGDCSVGKKVLVLRDGNEFLYPYAINTFQP